MPKNPLAPLALLLLITLALQTPSFASDPTTTPTDSTPDFSQPIELFPKGLWTGTMYGSYASQPGHKREEIGAGTFGFGYFIFKNFSINFELTGVGISQTGGGAALGGGDILIRNHLYCGKGWSFFWDFGAGILEADKRVPPTGTDFNLTLRTGPGVTIRLNDHLDFLAGARYMHLSNAHQEGPSRNPSINAAEAYFGLLYKFGP